MEAAPESDAERRLGRRVRALTRKRAKLKQRHLAALREIAFLRARLQAVERYGPQQPIMMHADSLVAEVQPRKGQETLWKSARDRLLWSGLTADQAFFLECDCLQRLARVTGQCRPHFPQLIAMKPQDYAFEITHQGPTVLQLVQEGTRVEVPDMAGQVARIVAQMRAASVIHLDMHPDGRNLSVAEDGHVSVIDFDIAACDEVAFSGMIERHLRRFHANGGHDGFARLLHEILAQIRQ